MEMSEYHRCSFDGSRFGGSVGNARFVNCSFRDVRINHLFSHTGEFINCVFSGRMKEVVFNGSVVDEDDQRILGRRHNEFYGNDFSGVEMIDFSFRTGIDLTQQRLPDSDRHIYIAHPEKVLPQVRAIVTAQSESEQKRSLLISLHIYEENVVEGQKQLLIERDDEEKELFLLLQQYALPTNNG